MLANAPPPEPITQALIDAAKKEGQVVCYTSIDLLVAEKLAKAFEFAPNAPAPTACFSASARIFLQHSQVSIVRGSIFLHCAGKRS